jgi:hypothetical protein
MIPPPERALARVEAMWPGQSNTPPSTPSASRTWSSGRYFHSVSFKATLRLVIAHTSLPIHRSMLLHPYA